MSLTSDLGYLAVAVSSYINVFSISDVGQLQFEFFDRIVFSHSDFRNVKLNDDFMYLFVANGAFGDTLVYANNGSGFEAMSHITDTVGFSYQEVQIFKMFKFISNKTQFQSF